MDNTDPEIKSIITRFIEGSASEQELAALEEWFRKDRSNRIYFDEFVTTYHASVTMNRFHQQKTDDAWNKISERIQVTHEARSTAPRQRYLTWVKIAASVSLIVLAGFATKRFLRSDLFNTGNNTVVVNTQPTKMGIQLPDGSYVWLNANSALDYAPSFATSNRIVNLKGEAFFDVRKNGRPFIVKTGALEVHVKGTKFNVQAYQDDAATQTTLEEGAIDLHIKGKMPVYSMEPGDQITLAASGGEVIRKKVDPSDFSAWKESRLVFDNTPLENVLARIGNRYRARIVLDAFASRKELMTMTIEDETLDEVLELIRLSSHLNMKKEKDLIVLY
ncbi:FecR domain-containing protein [Fulvivirgaceae bacterium PWU4]|uniref:FecR domain-containing protein n=1 Tax=Chryseosolibacter histidini TaxID=2782349 RepID=A0AAP2GQN0_9BACT|nr:FecR family protein [Chryseosolibacter histidini]MBT1698707.1 FecR domain-containing protein [Chryseosolibacter histidini]